MAARGPNKYACAKCGARVDEVGWRPGRSIDQFWCESCDRKDRADTLVEVRMMPPRECSPNGGWSMKARMRGKKAFREEAKKAAAYTTIGDASWMSEAKEILVDIEIEWAQGRKRMDDDNAIASCKAARDGIAEILLGGDDRKLKMGKLTQVRGEGITTFMFRALRGDG